MLGFEISIIALLILLNGFFAMSELAVVSARRARLQQMAQAGSRGAQAALKLIEDPTGFLSTVQIGITLVGIFAGAYSGSTLAGPLAELLKPYPLLAPQAETLAFVLVVVCITYLSLIAGELVPKRIALNHAERIAALVAPVMLMVAKVGAPLVWFLRHSTELVLRLLGVRPKPESTVTEEEVKSLIAEGTDAGVFEPQEKRMIEGVLKLADRPARSIMVPRPDVTWLDLRDPAEIVLKDILESGHSRFPVNAGDRDEIIGIVHAKDLLDQQTRQGRIDLKAALRAPLFVTETMPVLKLLESFKSSTVHMAIVLDEHGGFEGIVTPTDILIAVAGDLPEDEEDRAPYAVQREDGSWLLDGRMPVDEAEKLLGASGMDESADYTTLAGFVLHRMGHLPEAGESFTWRDWRFEVVDMDGRRIDKLLAARLENPD